MPKVGKVDQYYFLSLKCCSAILSLLESSWDHFVLKDRHVLFDAIANYPPVIVIHKTYCLFLAIRVCVYQVCIEEDI